MKYRVNLEAPRTLIRSLSKSMSAMSPQVTDRKENSWAFWVCTNTRSIGITRCFINTKVEWSIGFKSTGSLNGKKWTLNYIKLAFIHRSDDSKLWLETMTYDIHVSYYYSYIPCQRILSKVTVQILPVLK